MDENVSTRIHSHPYFILFRLVEGKKNGWLDKIGLKNSDYCDTYLLFCPIFVSDVVNSCYCIKSCTPKIILPS